MPTRTVSYSEIDSARQCLLKHQFGYKERWQPPTEGRALVRGKLWHNVMEDHYRAIKTWHDAGDTEFTKWRIEAERDRLIKIDVTLGPEPGRAWRLEPLPTATTEQTARLNALMDGK